MGQQVGDPLRIADVGLAARDVPNVLGVGEHELEAFLQHVPDRPPVDPGRFHRHMRAAVSADPVGKRQQLAGRGRKVAGLVMARGRDAAHAGNYRVLVDIEPRAARIQNLHRSCSFFHGAAPEGALDIEVY